MKKIEFFKACAFFRYFTIFQPTFGTVKPFFLSKTLSPRYNDFMKSVKQIIFSLIILVLAFAGAAVFTACGSDPQDADDQTTATSETSTTSATEETMTETQPPVRQTLKILLPVSKYKDVEKFADKYNADENKYTIDLALTETSDGIDPMDYDALIIPGGKHVHPDFYGAEIECTEHKFDPELDQLEIELVDSFVAAKKPILGICRGCQLIIVAFGGTLNQDIGMEHYHDSIRETLTMEGSDMRRLFGESFETEHFHHQAVDRLADGMRVTMIDAEDGTIEGYQHTALPICAVQFHPDRMYVQEDPGRKETARIYFDYFFDLVQSLK